MDLDTYTKSLLHFDSSGTTFTDETGKTWTANGNAVSHANKFDGFAVFDGSGDYISASSSVDFALNGDFTIDFWVRFDATALSNNLNQAMIDISDGTNHIAIEKNRSGLGNYWYANVFGVSVGNTTEAPAANTWYHVSLTRSGTTIRLSVNGTLVTNGSNTTSGTFSSNPTIHIGRYSSGVDEHIGWMDEFRISKGIARWTANFTPSTTPYTYDATYDEVLLHFDADGTTFTDESGKTWTANGNVNCVGIKFDGMGWFDGNGDYITTPDSDDFHFGTGDFSADFWVKIPSGTQHTIFEQAVDSNNFQICYLDSNIIIYTCYSASAYVMRVTAPFTISPNTWYHIALARSGSTFYIFVDGVSQTVTVTHGSVGGTIPNFGASMKLGYGSVIAIYLKGWLDEYRISKGIARWTANFTPLTRAYGLNVSGEYGSFSYTGQVTGTYVGRLLAAAYETYTYTGQTIALAIAKGILAAYGAYVYTGNSILLAAVRFFASIYLRSTNNSISVIGQDIIRTVLSTDTSKKVRE